MSSSLTPVPRGTGLSASRRADQDCADQTCVNQECAQKMRIESPGECTREGTRETYSGCAFRTRVRTGTKLHLVPGGSSSECTLTDSRAFARRDGCALKLVHNHASTKNASP